MRNILSRKQQVTDIDLKKEDGKLRIEFEVLMESQRDINQVQKTLERLNASGIEYTTKNLDNVNNGFGRIIFKLEDTHDTLLKVHAGLEKAAAKSVADVINKEAELVPANRQADYKKRILKKVAEELGIDLGSQKDKSPQR